MKHVLHVIAVAVAAILATLPTTFWTSTVTNTAANHPAVVGYLVVATAILTKVVKVLGSAVAGKSTPPGPTAPGGGSDTMKAK